MNVDVQLLHVHLLNMMKEFHQVCVKNNIKYYMLGGTCLGAVRHKGFIPWDDDMDVGMPREDYDRFCKIAREVLPYPLEMRYYETCEDSPFHFVKLINCNTTLVERAYKNYVEGIYIDVFPLDEMKNFGFLCRIRTRIIWFLHALTMNHSYTKDGRGALKRCFERVAKMMKMRKVHAALEKLMTYDKGKKHNLMLCNFLGAYGMRECAYKNIYGKPTLYDFEDGKFYGPENVDLYLRHFYKDYMTLPPEKDRVCKHDYYYVNLALPYRDYLADKVDVS